MASAARIMDKPRQDHQQPQAAALRCPRCDSSNTKFCYYNNYSLSQPRHFCKACKRYWTRGGTLRNVPVGGGCRKNKRLKSSSVNAGASSSPASSATQNPRPQNGINLSSVSNHISPMFYGVQTTNPSDLNLQFSSLGTVSGLNDAMSLGFSSGFLSHTADLQDGCNPTKQIQDLVTSNHLQTISFERNMLLLGNSGANLMPMKEEKMESLNRFCQNQTDQQIDLSFSDPSHYWNPTTATGNWAHDPANTGSSLTSLFQQINQPLSQQYLPAASLLPCISADQREKRRE